ncbi:MAG: DUF11 domain-containing protein [Scytonematopsis contorta HA4267-MV1]|nr:DUF11 domain-containing protein [Scytonematopsis contorta HA4267-MV1]
MKNFSIANLGTVALIAAVPLTGTVPALLNIWEVGSAIAQNIQKQPQVQLQLDAEKLVITKDTQGKENKKWQTLKGQAVVLPGDILRYTISGKNISDKPVKNLVIDQAIPKGTIYVLKSAKAVNNVGKIYFRVDAESKFVENPTVKVTVNNGKVATQPAPANKYTHIRFILNNPVAVNTTVKGTYEVRVRQ